MERYVELLIDLLGEDDLDETKSAKGVYEYCNEAFSRREGKIKVSGN